MLMENRMPNYANELMVEDFGGLGNDSELIMIINWAFLVGNYFVI